MNKSCEKMNKSCEKMNKAAKRMKVKAKRTYTATNGAQENKGDARTGRCDGAWRRAKLFMTGLCYAGGFVMTEGFYAGDF